MKAMTLRTILALGTVMVAGLAVAQQGGPAGGGQRGGGMQGGRMGAMMMSPVFLINREDVQKDLKLTDDQKAKLAALRESMPMMNRGGGRGGAGGGGGRGGAGGGAGAGGGGGQGGAGGGAGQGGGAGRGGQGGGFDPAEMEKQLKEAEAKINEILTDEQEVRIKQIGVQLQGGRALMNETIQKDLGMTADQKKKVNDLNTAQQQANMELFQRVQNQEISREEVGEIMQKNNKILEEELLKVLTADQKTKFDAMKGPKFEATQPQGGRGGAGGRGGGN